MGLARTAWFPITPGEQMVLEANPNYFGESANHPELIIRYFQDPTTMAQAVENGEIDIAWRTLGPVEAVRLEGVEGLTVTKVDAPVAALPGVQPQL